MFSARIYGWFFVSVCVAAITASFASVPPPKNHLAASRSAYLQRASDQAVEWYPWGDEAWRKAK